MISIILKNERPGKVHDGAAVAEPMSALLLQHEKLHIRLQKGKPSQLGIIKNTPRKPGQDKIIIIIKYTNKQRQQEIRNPQKHGTRRRVAQGFFSRLCELLALINKILLPLLASERAAETPCCKCTYAESRPKEKAKVRFESSALQR